MMKAPSIQNAAAITTAIALNASLAFAQDGDIDFRTEDMPSPDLFRPVATQVEVQDLAAVYQKGFNIAEGSIAATQKLIERIQENIGGNGSDLFADDLAKMQGHYLQVFFQNVSPAAENI